MRLQNLSTIPTETVREVIRFVCPSAVTRYGVRVFDHTRSFKGRASPAPVGGRVNIFIGLAEHFPIAPEPKHPKSELRHTFWYDREGKVARVTSRRVRAIRRSGGYLPLPALGNRVEALVYVMAHELRHLWQARVPRGRRCWGSRSQYSERDADAYAIHMLREWRRSGPTL